MTAILLVMLCHGTIGSADRERKRLVSLAVIVNPENVFYKDLKLKDVERIFKLDRQFWPDRRRISLYLPARNRSTERRILLETVYEMSEQEFSKFLNHKRFTGEISKPPSEVRTIEEAMETVRTQPHALSVVLSSRVSDRKDVRVLAIDGKKPGHEQYQLVGEVSAETGD